MTDCLWFDEKNRTGMKNYAQFSRKITKFSGIKNARLETLKQNENILVSRQIWGVKIYWLNEKMSQINSKKVCEFVISFRYVSNSNDCCKADKTVAQITFNWRLSENRGSHCLTAQYHETRNSNQTPICARQKNQVSKFVRHSSSLSG